MKTEEVLAVALNLSESDRVYLATRLLESVPDLDEQISMDDPDFFEELDRRFADLSGAVPFEDFWKHVDAT
jgi:hypothetical protein